MTDRRRMLGGIAGAATIAAALAAAPRAKAAEDAAASARVELWRRLFFDPAIGRQGKVACAACHDPEHGFSDARARSQDETRELPRHSQPLVDLAGQGFHWDGSFETVRDVVDARTLPGPLAATAAAERALRRVEAFSTPGGARPDSTAVRDVLRELGAGGPYGLDATRQFPGADEQATAGGVRIRLARTPETESIDGRIARGGRYDVGFAAAFGDADVTPQRVGDALEAYLGSIKSSTNAYDRFAAGDAKALDESARRGLDLFRGKANCSQCHVLDGARAAFSDGKFHNTGVATAAESKNSNPGDHSNFGRLAATFAETDRGAFKTPSLRDVARRAPYFHDASMKTLEEVVRYYDKGGTSNDHLDPSLHKLSLADEEIGDLVRFLESLTGDVRPGLGEAAATRASKFAVRVENLDGTPVAGRTVVVRPFGDRLAGTNEMPQAVTLVTGADGRAVADMPASTHVVVEGLGVGRTEPLPDWTTSTTLVAVPNDQVALRVRFREGVEERPATLLAYVGSLLDGGAPMKFERVRDLGASETLYACAPPANVTGKVTCTLGPNEAKYVKGGTYVIDFARGTTNVVDLRALRAPTDRTAAAKLAMDVMKLRAFAPIERK